MSLYSLKCIKLKFIEKKNLIVKDFSFILNDFIFVKIKINKI